jgi:glycerol-3-phosphate acyltransferase PlsY
MDYMISIAGGYLLGSLPFGLILAKLAGRGDLRKIGSGNIGATNAMRAGGLGLALPVFLLDMAKGFASVYFLGVWAGVAAVVGHCFPVWLKFRGGKGVSTSAGFLFAASPALFAVSFAAFAFSIAITGYSSLSAFVAMPVAAAFGFYLSNEVGFAVLGLCALILWRERGNIRRLINGTEPKIKWRGQ